MSTNSRYQTKASQPEKRFNFKHLTSQFEGSIESAEIPSCACSITYAGEQIYSFIGGQVTDFRSSGEDLPVSQHTLYDLGNLTGVICSCAILYKLIEEKRVSLSDQVIRFVQSFSVNGKSLVTIGDLLYHVSGLDSSRPYHEDLIKETYGNNLGIMTSPGAREFIYNRINRAKLKHKLRDQQVYSDLGLILIGRIIEEVCGCSIAEAFNKYVVEPLGMNSSGFMELNLHSSKALLGDALIAPTENCSWRKRQLCGEVLDDNAWAMGGLAGHAGLFSTLNDLQKFCNEMINVAQDSSEWLQFKTLNECWRIGEDNASAYVGGWEKPCSQNVLNELGMDHDFYGFMSNTGCMVWISPSRELQIIYLSNACYPSRHNKKSMNIRYNILKSIFEVIKL